MKYGIKFLWMIIAAIMIFQSDQVSLAGETFKKYTEWDILGIRLGSNSRQAEELIKNNIPNIVIKREVVEMQSSTGLYTTPPITFGASGEIKDNGFNYVALAYDLTSNEKVIGIRRQVSYQVGQCPTYDTVVNKLIEKYGMYDFDYDGDLVWIREMSPDKKFKNKASSCRNSFDHLFQMQFSGEYIDNKCGIILSVKINTMNELVSNIEFRLGNFIDAKQSHNNLITQMKEGEESEKQKASEQGDKVKLNF